MKIVGERSLRQSDINNIVQDTRDNKLYRLELIDIENKEELNHYIVCPLCNVNVKIRNIPGKSLHYVHPNGQSHSNESFVHYFTKYFIADHITSVRDDIDIHLEKVFSSGRRADVGTSKTFGSHRIWNNIEVEYKNTDPYDFLQKMKLLHDDKVITQWVLDYDKFYPRGKMSLPKIAEYVMRFQHTLLTTRFHEDGTLLIGTVIDENSDKFAKEFSPERQFNIEEVLLEDCEYSPYIGLITPQMKQLYGWGKNFDIQQEEAVFERDQSFYDFINTFYPSLIYPHGSNYGIKTLPTFWMHLVYHNFISNQVGRSFTLDDAVNFLKFRNINTSKWSIRTLEVFLDHLVNTTLMCTSEISTVHGETVYTVTSDKPADFFLYSL